ncbi:MAG: FGGY family carbohydrate kinase [Planctomycetes bacterium]|nr:FGGY family carbohydrate kinase [Planctomycetota bacterium]
MWVLGVDIGTTNMKLGVFRPAGDTLELVRQFSQSYAIHVYNNGLFADIEQQKWQDAFVAGCHAMAEVTADIDIIAISGTTPGLTAMDDRGEALYPAILMLDQRSQKQAREILDTVGLDRLLAATANMPVAGGCSLAGILWLRDNAPEVFKQAHKFGHSNTYFAHWLTGAYAIDPSSASLTGLYNTTRNDYTWNDDLVRSFGLSASQLPELIPAYASVGAVRPALARELGFTKEPQVLIGGNDAVLAAYSVGVREPGQIINVNGTCEISLVCLPRCLPSPHYNIRAHVLPDRWLTLHVMNAGGKALEWFKSVFCSEMADEEFYSQFLPRAVDAWLDRDSAVTYTPYLMGSRYSLDPLQAELLGLTQTTTREEILAAIVRGLCRYQSNHLHDIEQHLPLQHTIHLTGGAVNPALIHAKRKWLRDCDYVHEEDSSVKGAALLARLYLERR